MPNADEMDDFRRVNFQQMILMLQKGVIAFVFVNKIKKRLRQQKE